MKENKDIEMALLDQLCKLIDKSAMEGYHTKSGKLEPEYAENKEEVYETGEGKPVEKNWGWSKEDMYEDDSEINDNDDDPINKLRKLAKKKEGNPGKEY